MKIVSFIYEQRVIKKVLAHLVLLQEEFQCLAVIQAIIASDPEIDIVGTLSKKNNSFFRTRKIELSCT